MKNAGITDQGISPTPSITELTKIHNHLETKYQKIIKLSYRAFLLGVADYIKFVLNSAIWLHIKNRIQQEKQRDVENYDAMKNEEDKPWRLSPSIWLAWEKTGVIYDMVYARDGFLELEKEVNDIGLREYIKGYLLNQSFPYSEREQQTRETFDRVHSFIIDEVFALQNQISATTHSINSIKLSFPEGKKYKALRKLSKILLEIKDVDNFQLAKCLNPKLTKGRYKQEKHSYNEQIQHCLKTIRKHWRKSGYSVQFNQERSKVIPSS